MDLYNELSSFREALKDYRNLLSKLQQSQHQPLPADYQSYREKLLINSSHLVLQIKALTGKDESLEIYEMGKPRKVDMWQMGLRNQYDYRTVETLDACIDNTNLAIGKLEADIKTGIRDEQGNLIKPEKLASGSAESPLDIFDAMRLHPKVIEASRELFKDGHYRDAIYRAFVEVNNFVKLKAKPKRQLDGKGLMSAVFSPENPLIKLNSLETQTDKDEQEGFMYLFMGAMQGIRNPKAHENIIQNNPYIALKLLGFASLLIETINFWKAGDT